LNVSPPNSNIKPVKTLEDFRKPYDEVAEGMERQFTNYLLDQMKKGIPKDGESSSAREFYESQLDGEYAEAMAKSDSGIGIKKVILEQILPPQLKKTPVLNRDGQNMYNKISQTPLRSDSKELRDE
jgi:Rod binding domain-containing protein